MRSCQRKQKGRNRPAGSAQANHAIAQPQRDRGKHPGAQPTEPGAGAGRPRAGALPDHQNNALRSDGSFPAASSTQRRHAGDRGRGRTPPRYECYRNGSETTCNRINDTAMWAGVWDSDRRGAVSLCSAATYGGRTSLIEAFCMVRPRERLPQSSAGNTRGLIEAKSTTR